MKKKLMMLFLFLIFFVSIGTVLAADPIDDGRDVNIEANSIEELNTKFNDGTTVQNGDTIYLGNKTFSSTSSTSNPLININVDNIIINGGTSSDPNAYSTFKSDYPLLGVTGSNVTFLNIRFSQNYYYQGNDPYTSINSNGNIEFINCSFDNLKSTAININSATNLDIVNCTFSNIESDTIINFYVTNNFICSNNNFDTINAASSWSVKKIIVGNANSYNISHNNFKNIKSVLFDLSTSHSNDFIMAHNNFTEIGVDSNIINIGEVTGEFICHDNNFAEILAGNEWGGAKFILTGSAGSYNISNNNFTDLTGILFSFSGQSSTFLLNNNNITDLSSGNSNPTMNIGEVTGAFTCNGNNFNNLAAEQYGTYNNIISGIANSYNISNNNFTDIKGGLFDFTDQSSSFTLENNTFINITAPKPVINMGEVLGEFNCKNNDFINIFCEQYGNYYKLITGTAGSYEISNCNFKNLKGSLFEFTNEATEFVLNNSNFTEITAGNNPIMDVAADSYEISNCNFKNLNAILFEFGASESNKFILKGNNFTNLTSSNSVVNIGKVTGEFVCNDNDFINVNSGTNPLIEGTAGSYEISNCNFKNLTTNLFNFNEKSSTFILENNNFTDIISENAGILNFGEVLGEFKCYNNNFINLTARSPWGQYYEIIEGTADSYNISGCNFDNLNGIFIDCSSKPSNEFILENNNFTNFNSNGNNIIDFGTVTGNFICTNNKFINVSSATSGAYPQYKTVATGSANNYIISDCIFNNLTGALFTFTGTTSSKCTVERNNFTEINSPRANIINFGTVTGDFICVDNNFENLVCHDISANLFYNTLIGTAKNYLVENSTFTSINGSVLKFVSGENLDVYNTTFQNLKFRDPILHFTIDGRFMCENNTFKNLNSSNFVIEGTGDTYHFDDCNFRNVNAGIVKFGTGTKCEIYDININTINLDNNLVQSSCKNTTIRDCSLANVKLNGNAMIKINSPATNSSICNLTLSKCKNGEGIIIESNYTSICNTSFIGFESETNGGAIILRGYKDSVENCNFTNCYSGQSGGAIGIGGIGSSTVNNCIFTNITAWGSGGAIIIRSPNAFINNSKFIDNNSTENTADDSEHDGGGAICVDRDNPNCTIANCYFENNTGTNSGGAIRIATRGSSIINCTFIGNYVETGSNIIEYGGGAIWAAWNTITINNSKFYSNQAPYGGAIRGAADIDGCIFVNNTATDGNGGGIDLTIDDQKISIPYVKNSQFYNNTALGKYNNDDRAQGGGLHTWHLEAFIVENCTFINNTAFRGGGLDLLLVNESYIYNNTFNNNYAIIGGGIDLVGDNAILRDNEVSENVALRGAGIQIQGDNANIFDCYIAYNVANSGGGLWITGANTNITNTIIEYNEAIMGGAIYKYGEVLNLTNVTIHHNTANLYTSTNVSELLNFSMFESYEFEIEVDGYNTTVYYTFYENDVPQPPLSITFYGALGGGIYTEGSRSGNSIILNCLLYHNTARNGSAIYVDAYHMNIDNSSFYSNCAWSYRLPINFNNTTINVGESLKGNVTLIGGDNLINGIYNTRSPTIFDLNNVTYEFYNGTDLYNRTTIYDTPVLGWENSNNGNRVYQDDRENNQIITITITNKARTTYYTTTGRTDITGNVYFETPTDLPVGNYYISAIHENGLPDHPSSDYYYTDIDNSTTFAVIAGNFVDVMVTKQANTTTVELGEFVNWTITVKNNGAIIANNVVVKDLLPEGLEFISASQTGYNEITGTWNIGNLNANQEVTLNITTKTTKIGNITNLVTVNTTSDDINLSNNKDNDTIEVTVHVDVSVVKEANVSTAYPGELISWTITINNNASYVAKDVVVKDLIPEGLEFISASQTGYDKTTGTWNIGDMNPNESVILTIITKVIATETTNITNIATVTTTSNDTNLSNNKDNDTVKVVAVIDVGVIKVVNVTNTHPGDLVSWTITVTNNKLSTAKDVVVKDLLPEGLEFISATPEKGIYDNGNWTIGDMNGGEIVKLIIITKVTPTIATNITNIATVTTTSNDTNPGNDKDNATIKVDPICDVAVNITVNQSIVYHEDIISWTINITNYGPSLAENTNITISLPDGVEFMDVIIPENTTYNNETHVWSVGTLEKGQNLTLIINTKVKSNATGILTTIANITTSTLENNLKNNIDHDSTKIIVKFVDLEISKNSDSPIYGIGDKIIWTIMVHNIGNSVALNVSVTDILPNGVRIIEFTASKGTYENSIWNIGNLTSDEYATLTITCEVLNAGKIINFVNVTTLSNETDYTNNYANSTIIVKEIENPIESNNTDENNTNTINNQFTNKETLLNTGNPLFILLILFVLPILTYRHRKE